MPCTPTRPKRSAQSTLCPSEAIGHSHASLFVFAEGVSHNVQSCRRGSRQRAVIAGVSEANGAGNWLLSEEHLPTKPGSSQGLATVIMRGVGDANAMDHRLRQLLGDLLYVA